jgi:hypothetical protein
MGRPVSTGPPVAHLDTVKVREAKDETWGTTPLSWALFGWNNPPPETTPERYYRVVAVLAGAGATVKLEWLTGETVRADPRMLAALGGEMPAE